MTSIHNRPTAAVIEHLTKGKAPHMTAAEVAALTGVKERMVETTLDTAPDMQDLVKRRVAGQIVYCLPSVPAPAPAAAAAAAAPTVDEHTKAAAATAPPAAPEATAAPQPERRSRNGRKPGHRIIPLPPIDIGKISITLRPKADGRQRAPAQTKWGPLFERLAKMPPNGQTYPTAEIDKVYGKAVQAAARKYSQDTGIKLKVSINHTTVVQRVD